jgi:segregation and condensation protein A
LKYQVTLPVFEGPLDLLLHLIDANELDIYNIPIAFITGQYIEYMQAAEEIDLNLSSEFVLMAGTLLTIKAKTLLPKRCASTEETAETMDPRDELVEKLVEYRVYKKLAAELKKLSEAQEGIFYREVDDKRLLQLFTAPNPVGNISVKDLGNVFLEIVRNLDKRQKSVKVPKEEITLQHQASFILKSVKKNPHGVCFQSMMSGTSLRVLVTTFMALLELMHRGKVWVRQQAMYGDIRIFLAKE